MSGSLPDGLSQEDLHAFLTETVHLPGLEGPEAEPARERKADPWPAPMHPYAYHGLLGRIVRGLTPITEADPVALLGNLIMMMGSAMGRNVHVKADGAMHFPNINGVVVGPTSSGRKGTATARSMELMTRADPTWSRNCQGSGLSSSEGLLSAVRDESAPGAADGVEDKRLMVVEAEFASVLKQGGRSGNTLSELLRKAFDTGHLRSMTKVSKTAPAQRATAAHISVLGHITAAEMKSTCTTTDASNGLLNRFWIGLVRRSKLLPFGGDLDPATFAGFAREIAEVLDHTRMLGDKEIHLTAEARDLWASAYGILTADRPGLAGSVTSRSAPISLRMALVYAMCDRVEAIDPRHLLAGLAFVDYGIRSVEILFGGVAGDPVEDAIFEALVQAEGPLTRTDISKELSRNVSSVAIGTALQSLDSAGRVERVKAPSTGGRPAELWRLSARWKAMGDTSSLSGWLKARKTSFVLSSVPTELRPTDPENGPQKEYERNERRDIGEVEETELSPEVRKNEISPADQKEIRL